MNKAKCKSCGDIIESKHRRDWVCCSCFSDAESNTGIYIDGGEDYWRQGGNFDDLERIEETHD